jgi:hypothetical protein
MTLNQLSSLTEDELIICLYVLNVIDPVRPPIEFSGKDLTWVKNNAFIQKLLNAFPHIKPEAHSIYASLMLKLGIKIEINPIASSEPQIKSDL